ncbi:MAG: hypothetical protein AAB430_00855 [Patescibacteria group bacterium]
MTKNKRLTVGILGIGEVGSSIAKLVKSKHKLLLKDINLDEIQSRHLDVLHVCLPYSQNFNRLVLTQTKLNRPGLVIIDSTVPLKNTETLHQSIKKTLLVHSPIRGTHPYLARDIKKFTKFIGPTSVKAGRLAKQYYAGLGVKSVILDSSRATELGKLLDTTYYALCIAWHQEMARFCRRFKIDFDQAITQFNTTYNQGYCLTKSNVLRPVLTPGFIGGHCLMPNIALLKKTFKSDFLNLIIQSNNKIKS